MVEEQGRVVSAEQDTVWIETERKTTCSSCNVRHGCGQHLADKYKPSSAFAYIRASSEWSLSEGDRVLVGIPESSLLKASAVAYLLPLLLIMMALWIAQMAQLSDGVALLFAGCALIAGFIPARKLWGQETDLCRVKVVRVLSRQSSSSELLPMRNI